MPVSKQTGRVHPPGCRDCPGCPWAKPLSASVCPPRGPPSWFWAVSRGGGQPPANAGASLGTAAGPRSVTSLQLEAYEAHSCGRRTHTVPELHWPQSHTLRTVRCWRGPGRSPGAAGRRGHSPPRSGRQARPTERGARFQRAELGRAGRTACGKGHTAQQGDKCCPERCPPTNPASSCSVRSAPRRPLPTMLCFASTSKWDALGN